MLPDRVSNPGPLTYESGALPIGLCGPAPPNNVIICGKIMIKQVFCGFFSNLMVKFWKSRKYFYTTLSAVAAASFQT